MRTIVALALLVLLALSLFQWNAARERPAVEGTTGEPVERSSPDVPPEAPAAEELGGAGRRLALEIEADCAREPAPPRFVTSRVFDDAGTQLFEYEVSAMFEGRDLVPDGIDAEGAFRLEWVEAGLSYVPVRVSAPGHVTCEFGLRSYPGEVERVMLPRLVKVSGRVLTRGGEPVPGAFVYMRPMWELYGAREFVAKTDATGAFKFEAGAGHASLEVLASGFIDEKDLVVVLVPSDEDQQLEIRLGTGGAIEGRVEPLVPGARGHVVRARGCSPNREVSVNADGRFRIPFLAPGGHSLQIPPTRAEVEALLGSFDESGVRLLTRWARVEVVEDAVVEVTVATERFEPTCVVGRLSIDSAPPDEATLIARAGGEALHSIELETELDADGSFALPLLPRTWTLEFSAVVGGSSFRVTRRVDIAAGLEHHLDLQLVTGLLSGSVSVESGDRVWDKWIFVKAGDERQCVAARVEVHGTGGTWLVRLPVGRYAVNTEEYEVERFIDDLGLFHKAWAVVRRGAVDDFSGPADINASREGIEVLAGLHTDGVDFVLEPAGGVQFYLKTPDGFPLTATLRGVEDQPKMVLLVTGRGISVEVSCAPRAGEFQVLDLPPGTYEVSVASGPLELLAPESFEITPGIWANVELSLVRPLGAGK